MQRTHQRVGVFVDVQNMYYSARALYDQRVDFGEILKEAVGDRQLIRAFAYVIEAGKEEEGKFFDALVDRGYTLRSKELLRFHGGNEKGDWDIGMAIDMIKLADKLDAVVLVSGDGDFADVLYYLKSKGVQCEVMAFGSSASSQLREAADAVLDLSENLGRFLIPSRNKKRGGKAAPKRKTPMPKGKRPDPAIPMEILKQTQDGGQQIVSPDAMKKSAPRSATVAKAKTAASTAKKRSTTPRLIKKASPKAAPKPAARPATKPAAKKAAPTKKPAAKKAPAKRAPKVTT